MIELLSREFLCGLLIGFGTSGLTVSIIFWIDRIINFRWRRRRR